MSRSYPELASPLPSIYNGKLKESVFWTEREEGRVLPFKWLEMRAGAVETGEQQCTGLLSRPLQLFVTETLLWDRGCFIMSTWKAAEFTRGLYTVRR